MKTLLTQRCVERTNHLLGKTRLFDTELPGFMCEVSASGRKAFYVLVRDEYGRQRQKKVADFPEVNVKTARQMAAALIQSVRSGGSAVLDEGRERRACPTLEQFVRERYLPHARLTKRSWSTDESILRNHLLPALGHKRLGEISIEDMQNFYQQDLDTGAARGSANRRIILMRYIYNLALKWEVPGVTRNPARQVELLDPQNTRECFLSPDEMARLQRAVEDSPNPLLRYIVPTLLLTGMRKREVLDARWSDIDLEARSWYLPHTKSGKPRTVLLSEALVKLLRSVPRRVVTDGATDWVFANPATGKPFVSIFCAWDTARKKAQLPRVRIHDLRHTFASLLINSSYELYDVMNALGHTQMRTTMRYAHLSRARKQLAAEAVAARSGLGELLGEWLGGAAANAGAFDAPLREAA